MTSSINGIIDPGVYLEYCDCGKVHPKVEVGRYTDPDAFLVLAEDASRASKGSILLVQDENTREAAGERVAKELSGAGVKYEALTLPGGIEADDKSAQRVLDQSLPHGLIVAVGAGTINDLGKFAAGQRGITYWTVPTAPSMNGYTSAIAAIKAGGVKRTLPAPPPEAIYVDPVVIAASPLELRQAGFCDILAKSVSDIDWQIDSLLFGGDYCSLPSALVAANESGYLSRPEAIRDGNQEATTALFEGLLISGIAMALAGSSAPASGGEHLVSHFLDMREVITGRRPSLHGLQVGAGIILSAACYRELAGLESLPEISAKELFDKALVSISPVWGEIGPAVEKRYTLKKDQLLFLERLSPAKWMEVRSLCAETGSPEYYLGLRRRTGSPLTLESLNLGEDEFLLATAGARIIRERITILDLAAQAGVLEAASRKTLGLLSGKIT